MALKISIVTAAFNSEATIEDTLRSIDGQTYDEVEHLVMDGGSNDSTMDVLSRFEAPERKVVSEPDNGIYDAMNKGIVQASGDVIGFLNADDFYESSDVVAEIARAFQNPDVDIVFGNLRYVDAEDTSKVIRDWSSEPFREGMFRRGWMPPHPTVYARRAVFEEVGLFDSEYSICADWEWLFRAFEVSRHRTCFLDRYFVKMRIGGVSNSSISNVLRSNGEAMRAFRKHGQGFPIGFFPGKLIHRGRQFLQKRKSQK